MADREARATPSQWDKPQKAGAALPLIKQIPNEALAVKERNR